MLDPKAVAIVGVGAILPDAPDALSFWNNIKSGIYSIKEVPPDRWRTDLYFDPDLKALDKTYTKIGAWVQGFKFDPIKLGIPIPPRVLDAMDETQHWSIVASLEALQDYGYPKRELDPARVAVIMGAALGGEHHYRTTLRINIPEIQDALSSIGEFQTLSPEVQISILDGIRAKIQSITPNVTEDTIPGEIANIIAGRVANVFNFAGPNYAADAACASTHAAVDGAIQGLIAGHFDAALTGGVDRTMGPDAFVKFCKIGALSPDGSRPYAEGANGFVMGEGAAVFLLKRLVDAERNGDKIYAVIRGIGGSSDGKGKGITAPNPLGQQRAIERAWQNAGLSPATVGMIEGHGTSTAVGDVVEVQSLNTVFRNLGLPVGKIALGSVKSNIGHLKGAAGAVGILKTIFSLYEGVLPPSLNCERPNPLLDFEHSPFAVNTTLRDWLLRKGEIRRAGVSSFGFGGTNFHMVLEEHVPGMLTSEQTIFASAEIIPGTPQLKSSQATISAATAQPTPRIQSTIATDVRVSTAPVPYQGLLFIGAKNTEGLKQVLETRLAQVRKGSLPARECPSSAQVGMSQRLVIDYLNSDELLKRGEKALKALEADTSTNWQAYTAQGIYRGHGVPGKVVFMFPGQGSQYINMMKDLVSIEPVVAEVFKEADQAMEPILGKPLTSFIFCEGDEAAVTQAEIALRNTEITQPAMLTANIAIYRLMGKFGFRPDFVIGHSLGEYAALVAAGALSFAEALQVVSARGREMTKVSWEDNGCMAAVSAPLQEVEKLLKTVEGYVVIANINSPVQSVIGGDTKAVESAIATFLAAGFQAVKIPVSHGFHTRIVAPSSQPLRAEIAKKNIQSPRLPVIANVTGEIYPSGREEILDMLAAQVASPVQFVKSMQTLYAQGARVFVEIGPKRVLSLLAIDNLKDKGDVTVLATNHPRKGGVASFNEALCGLYAAGVNGEYSSNDKEANTPAVQVESVQTIPSDRISHSENLPINTSQGSTKDEVTREVLAIVSEKTGYPAEMLELDLDLEADLGIDTVKQAELFATLREQFHIPKREDLRLVDYNTLRKVIGFMQQGSQPATPEYNSAEITVHEAVSQGDLPPLASPGDQKTTVVSKPEPREIKPAAISVANEPTLSGIDLSNEGIIKHVLAVVSEKTGYPVEMLELDLDLEADLGIDTVKQAELFATFRQYYNIPRREDLRLADYNTLRKVIGFMQEAMPSPEQPEVTRKVEADVREVKDLSETKPTEASGVPVTSQEENPDTDSGVIKRRVPVPVLRPGLDFCSSSNLNLDAESRVLIVPDQGKVGSALTRLLNERKVQVLVLDISQQGKSIPEQINEWLKDGAIHGIYFLPALDIETPLANMSQAEWQTALANRTDVLFAILQAIPQKPFLVSATRLGGLSGYAQNDGRSFMGGATSGLTKAVAAERPEALVKVVDFNSEASDVFIASRLAAETLRDPATVEVGWNGDLRYSVTLTEKPRSTENDSRLEKGSVFLISGGTAGIIAPVVIDLATETQGSFYLLNRNPLPEPDDPILARLKTDRGGLLKEFARESGISNPKQAVEHAETKIAALERCAAALEMQKKVHSLGGKAVFLTCDITDAQAVQQAVEVINNAEGRVDVVIHAAGTDRSRRLEVKPPEEFHQTIAVKADGFFNLYQALLKFNMLPKAMIFFSSVSGRFGNTGQTDYSAANDLLCKLAQALPLQHPGLKCLALDWSAWAEVGMASRGGFPKLMKYAGIDMLSPNEAAPLVRAELTAASNDHEVILAGSLGPLTNPRRVDGGIDIARVNTSLKEGKPYRDLLGEVKNLDLHTGITIETRFDPKEQPFLKDHALNGIPIFPGVMGMEGFSQGAMFFTSELAGNKSEIEEIHLENVHFLAACKFYRDKARPVIWNIRPVYEEGKDVFDARLESDLELPTKKIEHFVHFTGRVHLLSQKSESTHAPLLASNWEDSKILRSEDIYKLYFHSPAFQVLEGVTKSGNVLIGKMRSNLPSPMASPDASFLTNPLIGEFCLQTAGVYIAGAQGMLGLPSSIEHLIVYRRATNGATIFSEVTPVEEPGGSVFCNIRAIDAEGKLYLEIKGFRSVFLPYTVEPGLLEPFKTFIGKL